MNRIDELIKRAEEERHTPLAEFIEKEGLTTYELGYEDILYADELNNAILPCYEFMILARERVDDRSGIVAEYAIYSQHDKDGETLMNSLNMNATYKLEHVGEETFDNMAAAVAYAFGLVSTLHANANRKWKVMVRNTGMWGCTSPCQRDGIPEVYDTEEEARSAAERYNRLQGPVNNFSYYYAEPIEE